MDYKKWILFCIGVLSCLYGLITLQILIPVVCISCIVVGLFLWETVIPALSGFLHNVQRIADSLEEIKSHAKSDTGCRRP